LGKQCFTQKIGKSVEHIYQGRRQEKFQGEAMEKPRPRNSTNQPRVYLSVADLQLAINPRLTSRERCIRDPRKK